MKTDKKTWFIAGISNGLGIALAQSVIDSGDFVTGTFCRQQQTDTFNKQRKDEAFALTLDITNPDEIPEAFKLIKTY